jgi:hypothetical protein
MTTAVTEIVIDKNRALELIDQAVAERGADFCYGDLFAGPCSYTYVRFDEDDDVVAACLVGVALHDAGVPIRELENLAGSALGLWGFGPDFDAIRDTWGTEVPFEGEPRDPDDVPAYAATMPLADFRDKAGALPDCTEAAARLFLAAQLVQDRGHNWGKAREIVHKTAELLGDQL